MIKKFIGEFKEFALRGNVMDMAVGVVIGGSFKGIVDSLVNDIITPFIGIFANQDFSDKVIMIKEVPIKYGSFITAIINFILMAFVIFMMVKLINKTKNIGHHEEVVVVASTKTCQYCKNEIPVEATRCGFCTSVIDEIKNA